MIPIFLFFVAFNAALTPGSTTPNMGMSKVLRISVKLLELAVLQATIMAFTFLDCKKRTSCKEYFVTVSFDLEP